MIGFALTAKKDPTGGSREKRAACLFRIHPGLFRFKAGLIRKTANVTKERQMERLPSVRVEILISGSREKRAACLFRIHPGLFRFKPGLIRKTVNVTATPVGY